MTWLTLWKAGRLVRKISGMLGNDLYILAVCSLTIEQISEIPVYYIEKAREVFGFA